MEDRGNIIGLRVSWEDFGWYLPYIMRDDFLGVQNYSKKTVDENGIATEDDERRCEFIIEVVKPALDARQDGVNVTGYLHWSLLDNFEWQAGYAWTFGLIAVNRTDYARTPKNSLKVLGQFNKEEQEERR